MVRLKEIANLCGVSEGTASKALRGKFGVNELTRQRVVSVASRYNYVPNHVVHAIQTGRTMTVGIACNDFANEFSGLILSGVLRRLFQDNYAGIIISWDLSVHEGERLLLNLAERRVDGILMFPPADTPSEAHLSELRAVHGPVVVIDQIWRGCPYDFVGSDDLHGAAAVTEHLIQLGHRRIANLHYSQVSSGRERMEGFRQAMFKHGVAIHDRWLREIPRYEHEGDAAYDRARELLSMEDRPSALVCFNDHVAVQAMAAAVDLGIRVPQELSVAGFADLTIAQRVRPRLTTVAQDPLNIGTQTAELMLERLQQQRNGDGKDSKRRLLLPTRLVVRDSTAQAPSPQ